MKLIKQPFFLIGIGSLVFAIAIAIVSSVLNPSVAVLNKFEKALNKNDTKLMAKCFSPSVDTELLDLDSMTSEMEDMMSMFGMKGKVSYEILAGEVVEEKDIYGEVTKKVPTVMVTKIGDEIVDIEAEDMELYTESGKDYLYTGYEEVEDYEDYLNFDFSDYE